VDQEAETVIASYERPPIVEVVAALDSQAIRVHRFRAWSFGEAHSLGTAGRRVGECG
jgi:hypothetical protein